MVLERRGSVLQEFSLFGGIALASLKSRCVRMLSPIPSGKYGKYCLDGPLLARFLVRLILRSGRGKVVGRCFAIAISGTSLPKWAVRCSTTTPTGLGSPVALTDTSRGVISRTRYEPYGVTAAGPTPALGYGGHVSAADLGQCSRISPPPDHSTAAASGGA